MAIRSFEDLVVWKEAHKCVLDIYKLTKTFPEDERYGLVTQIRRSAASISANIVEGYTRSRKEFIRYLEIARGSLEETKYHLILCKDLNYIDVASFKDLNDRFVIVGRRLNALRRVLISSH